MKEWITSRNAVTEILQQKSRDVFRLLVADGSDKRGKIGDIIELCRQRRIQAEFVNRSRLDSVDKNHQGLALEVSGFHYDDLPDIFSLAKRKAEPLFILLLDLIQDPQNLGTLIRTAVAAGMHGIILPQARAAGVTPAVVHSSSGATEHIPIVQMNLAQAIAELHKNDMWVVGLDSGDHAALVNPAKLGGNLAIVVGSEGEGLRNLTRNSCDELLHLPMKGGFESLNAAVAGSIVIYLSYIGHRQ